MLKVEKIKGFETLSESNQRMFKEFLKNFYAAWGESARATINPLSVSESNDNGSGKYIRFDYKIYGSKSWLHVKGPCKWY